MSSKLTNCKTCGKEVAITAKACPHCGEDRPGLSTKGCFTTILVLSLLFGLASGFASFCQSEAKDDPKKMSAPAQSLPSPTSSASPTQTAPSSPNPTVKISKDNPLLLSYAETEAKALAGDYQAQRNLAYLLSKGGELSGGSEKVERNPLLGCAWRIVILQSGHRSVDSTDVSNKELYCDKRLSLDERLAALTVAENLYTQIYGQ